MAKPNLKAKRPAGKKPMNLKPALKLRSLKPAKPLAAVLSKKELEALRKRDEIVVKYMPYATSIANRVAQSLASSVDYNDVLCNARLGLIEAAKKFDQTQEVDFRTFAYYRIKGAIFDGLRKSGWLPRTLYAKLKFEEASNEYLQFLSERGNVAPRNEGREISETVNGIASIYVMSLDANEDLEVEDESQGSIEKNAEFHQIRHYMRGAIDGLPDKEKQLIKMYYFQNKTLEDAGEKLGLSKSWACRLHARALQLLLAKIREETEGAKAIDEVTDEVTEEVGS